MRNLCTFIVVIGILTVLTFAGDSPSQSPTIKQFEVDEYNNVIKAFDGVDKQRSEIIADNLEYLRLECYANYPVQWIYTGNGVCKIAQFISIDIEK